MIPVLRPSCSDAEVEAVTAVLRSGWWGQGPRVEELEECLAVRYGYRHAVAVNSCTAALHLALLALGVGPGDEVIVPALTFVSTALAPLYRGARPVFADVRPDTLTLDWPDACQRCATERTKAIIPVDFAGFPAWDGPARAFSYPVVQDAAHSCGGVGYGDVVCLSFHPVKNLATGDGGAVLLNDSEQAERLRRLRWCGIDRSTWQRAGRGYAWDYDVVELGWKYHWNDIQASIALAQLDRLPEMNARRWKLAERYSNGLADVVECPRWHAGHTWHLYPIRVDAERRAELMDYLAARGISTGVHYRPLTQHPLFAGEATPPVTDREWRRLVSLPIYPDLTDDDQGQVIEAVRGFFEGSWARGVSR